MRPTKVMFSLTVVIALIALSSLGTSRAAMVPSLCPQAKELESKELALEETQALLNRVQVGYHLAQLGLEPQEIAARLDSLDAKSLAYFVHNPDNLVYAGRRPSRGRAYYDDDPYCFYPNPVLYITGVVLIGTGYWLIQASYY